MVGAAFGAPARYWVDRHVSHRFGDPDGTRIPFGTLTVNVLGSLLLGMIVAYGFTENLSAAFGTGMCGSFTTFSTFAAQTDVLQRGKQGRLAVLNIALSVVLCVLAYWAGWHLLTGITGG